MKPEDLKPQYLKSGDIIKIGKSNPLYPELYGVIVECPVLIPNTIPYSWSTKRDAPGQAASILLQDGRFVPWIHAFWLDKVEE